MGQSVTGRVRERREEGQSQSLRDRPQIGS